MRVGSLTGVAITKRVPYHTHTRASLPTLHAMPAEAVARVSNLTANVTESHLRELLRHIRVKQVVMPAPLMWMRCPGGRVEVVGETEEDTLGVYATLHGAIIDGNRINVSFVKIDPSLPPAPCGDTAAQPPLVHRDHRRDMESSPNGGGGHAHHQRSGSRSSVSRDSQRKRLRRSCSHTRSPSHSRVSSSTSSSPSQRPRSPSPEWG